MVFLAEPCLCWLSNANDKEINNIKFTCPTKPDANVPHVKMGLALGLALGITHAGKAQNKEVMQFLRFVLGPQGFLHTYMLVLIMQKS